jgi:hypothetical protein
MLRTTILGIAITLATSTSAFAAICWTNAANCAGTWRVENTTQDKLCYTIFWASGGSKNFCLKPGESASEEVQSGDSYCTDIDAKPNANTCNRQSMTVHL